MLLAELRSLASEQHIRMALDTANVTFATTQSRAVPGLLYHWAGLPSPVIDHGGIMALVATRDTTMRVVRYPVEWSAVASGWEPGTREAAAWACAELYRIPTHGGPRDQAEVFGLDTLPTLALMPGERQWLQRQLPDTFVVADAPFPGIALRVRLWVVNPEISTVADEIACELPVPMWIMGQPANLAIIRSLPRFSGGRGAGNR